MPRTPIDVSVLEVIDAAARLIVQLFETLETTREARQDTILKMVGNLANSPDTNSADMAVLSAVLELLRAA